MPTDQQIESYVRSLRKSPTAYNVITNTVDYESARMKPVMKGPCSDILKESIECYINSSASIKGLDCADTFNSLLSCCKTHVGTCHPRLELDEASQ